MKNSFIIFIVGVLLGLVIGTSFKGCGGTPKPKIEYVEKLVEVPTDSIVYLPGEVRDTTIYSVKKVPAPYPVPGKTEYVFIHDTIQTKSWLKPFNYSDSLLTIDGAAIIAADTLYDFKISKLDITYKEKQTTIVKKRTFGLYGGGGIGFSQGDIKAVSLDLDLAIKERTLIGGSVEKPLVQGSRPIFWVKAKRSFW